MVARASDPEPLLRKESPNVTPLPEGLVLRSHYPEHTKHRVLGAEKLNKEVYAITFPAVLGVVLGHWVRVAV